MSRIYKILLIFLCLVLVVSAVLVLPVSASAATVPSSPYSDYNAPAGYYYFNSTVSNFSSINDFEYTVGPDLIYYGPYRVLKVSKVQNNLVCDLLDIDDVTVLDNRIIYVGDHDYWTLTNGLTHPVFFVANSLNVPHEFARLLLYRSASQSLIVKGRYKLLDSISFDSSVWQYKMTGEFFINGVLYDNMNFSNDANEIYASNSANNVSDFLRYDGVNNGEYTIDIPFAYVTLSVYNNFYNIFSQISPDSLYGSDYLYFYLKPSLSVPSFLDLSTASSRTFNVVGYFPGKGLPYVSEFSSLKFSYWPDSGNFRIFYDNNIWAYSSDEGYDPNYSFNLLKIRSSTAGPELLSYLELNSITIGGDAAFSYYEKIGYYTGLDVDDGSYNLGYAAGLSDAYGGYSYYWFTSLSESALNEIGTSGFLVDITLVYPPGVSNSLGLTSYAVRYDYLTYQDGQLMAAPYGEEELRVIYSNGSFVDDAYSYWCLSPGNSSDFVSWCDNNCYQKGYNALLFYSSNIGQSSAYPEGYDNGFKDGFNSGVSTTEGYNIGYTEGYDKGFSDGEVSGVPDLASWLDAAVGGFMELQIFPGFSIGGMMSVVVGVALLSFFLKLFMGG